LSISQFLVMAVIALGVTVPIVMLIPRARKSPLFDRVLWVATWALAFLGAWSAPGYFGDDSLATPWLVDQTPLIPTLIGAIVGALSIHVVLWLMDRFSPPMIEEDALPETAAVSEETNGEPSPIESNEKQ
jgi:hypothetical protein